MEIQCTHHDGYILVACEGQLDESTHRPFRDEVHPLFAQRGTKVIIDLTAAKWVNSEGIAAMVRLVTDANTRGCQVVYAGPNAFVTEVLEVTRLESYFDVVPTLEQAIEFVKMSSPTPTSGDIAS